MTRKVEHGLDDPDAYDAPQFRPSPPPKRALTPVGLRAQILDLRAAVRAEVPMHIHASSIPKLLNDDGTTDRKDADVPGLGLPFTSRMHRYIGHWSHWGQSRLGTLSIMEVSDWCHARHTDHSIPGSTRSLCAQMLHEVALLGQEPDDLAWLHGLPLEQVNSMLHSALNHAAEWRTGQERRSKGARFDAADQLPYEPLRRMRVAST